MMAAAGGDSPADPLYSFKNFKRYGSGYMGYVFCTEGNHFECAPSGGAKYYFDFNTSGQSQSNAVPSPVTTMFSLRTGDVVICKAKNIEYSSSHDGDQLLFMLRDSNDTMQGGFGASGGLVFPSAQTTLPDITVEKTMAANADIAYIRVNRQGSKNYSLTVNFDLEVYVNGVRYI